jgi:hypothetical protein
MKKCIIGLFVTVTLLFSQMARGQAQEVQQLLLNVEKLAQLKNILADLEKGYEIVSRGYGTIRNLSQGNFTLHKAFLEGLLEVSPIVKNYRRMSDIVRSQIILVKEYKAAFRRFFNSGFFTVDEIKYLQSVYENLISQSVKNLESLVMVVTSGALRMSDDERLTAIDDVWKEVSNALTFLRHFNQETKIFAMQRAKAMADIKTQKKFFSINK